MFQRLKHSLLTSEASCFSTGILWKGEKSSSLSLQRLPSEHENNFQRCVGPIAHCTRIAPARAKSCSRISCGFSLPHRTTHSAPTRGGISATIVNLMIYTINVVSKKITPIFASSGGWLSAVAPWYHAKYLCIIERFTKFLRNTTSKKTRITTHIPRESCRTEGSIWSSLLSELANTRWKSGRTPLLNIGNGVYRVDGGYSSVI